MSGTASDDEVRYSTINTCLRLCNGVRMACVMTLSRVDMPNLHSPCKNNKWGTASMPWAASLVPFSFSSLSGIAPSKPVPMQEAVAVVACSKGLDC